MKWFKTNGCASHVHCHSCRTDAGWRKSLRRAGMVDSAEFDCPHGVTPETAPAIQAEAIAKLPGYNPEAAAKTKEQLEVRGRAAWAWLHECCRDKTLTTERLIGEFLPMVPRYGCGCVREANDYIQSHPLPANPDDHDQWGIDFHNFINLKLGKPIWPY